MRVLSYLLAEGVAPLALLVSEPTRASHRDELIESCAHLPPERVFGGLQLKQPSTIAALGLLELDYLVCVHFPYLLSREVLSLAKEGALNLHPAFLPFNRGWHTPSWAILEGTPYGATLHFMDEGLDSGDIVHQRELEVSPGDTANSLYQRVKQLELQVFEEAWPALRDRSYTRTPQDLSAGSRHDRADLLREEVQRLDLPEEALRRLRALTTNDAAEAAFFEVEGRRYRVQLRITPEDH